VIEQAIKSIRAGKDLTVDNMSAVMDQVMQGRCAETQMATFLTLLHNKGETVDEIAGAAMSLRRHMTPICSSRENLIDTCGTGGDGSGTFNISTAAALVIAAAGVPVAKHGNRRITSKSGSADVLTALGVNVNADVSTVQHCLDELGICFCFAPLMHPSMKHVAAVRRQLGTPTIFNLLGPLCNPAAAPFQLRGVGRPALRVKLSAALTRLNTQRSAVVCGHDGLDEVTLSGATHVSLVTGGKIVQLSWTPAQFGLAECSLESLRVEGPEASATVIRDILAGRPGHARNIVILNAAAALWVAQACQEPGEAASRAAEAIDSGAARQLLERLARVSHTR